MGRSIKKKNFVSTKEACVTYRWHFERCAEKTKNKTRGCAALFFEMQEAFCFQCLRMSLIHHGL